MRAQALACLAVASTVLLAGCMVSAEERRVPLRLDVFNVDGADLGPVELRFASLHGPEETVYSGPVPRNATAVAWLPGDGGALHVQAGDQETGRTFAGDCMYPQATILLDTFPRQPNVVRIEVRSLCRTLPPPPSP
jgi:hypothetical protein